MKLHSDWFPDGAIDMLLSYSYRTVWGTFSPYLPVYLVGDMEQFRPIKWEWAIRIRVLCCTSYSDWISIMIAIAWCIFSFTQGTADQAWQNRHFNSLFSFAFQFRRWNIIRDCLLVLLEAWVGQRSAPTYWIIGVKHFLSILTRTSLHSSQWQISTVSTN